MGKFNFAIVIRQAMPDLVAQGYQFQKADFLEMVQFWKVPVTGVYCMVRFEPNGYPDFTWFKISLIRRRLEDFPENETQYKPLIIDLRNLMLGIYQKSIFADGQLGWEFTDEPELRKQLVIAQALVLEYGIKWLEDPQSNIEWVGRREKPT